MRRAFTALAVTGLIGALALPAAADHTNPTQPLSPLGPPLPGTDLLAQGAGDWNFITNIPPNPGSDLKYFMKDGDLYAAAGSLAQGDVTPNLNTSPAEAGWVGQRIIKLMDDGNLLATPQWIADHGSSHCEPNPNVLSLQHDQAVTPQEDPKIMVDSTDSSGRCHDPAAGGLEIIDISGLPDGSTVKEIHLTRHNGTSHTVTADPVRDGIFYNSSSESSGSNRPWIDIVDARNCYQGRTDATLAKKRQRCRPKIFRMTWEDHREWSERDPDGEEITTREEEPGSEAACHDITIVGDTMYCAGLNATLVFDIGGMFVYDKSGNFKVRGAPMKCPVVSGNRTDAMVTDCSGPNFRARTATNRVPRALGWRFLGNYNHPGRPANQANNNLEVPSDEGVSVSHESDPTPDGRLLMVTDERGGGAVPPGASCSPGIDNPYGNGGISFLDLTRTVPDPNPEAGHPPYFPYAETPSGDKAIWRGEPVVPAPDFCTVHVIHHMPDEARIFMGYYSQGIKVLDYFVEYNERGGPVVSFRETASLAMGGDNDWVAEPFHVVDNPGDPANPNDDMM